MKCSSVVGWWSAAELIYLFLCCSWCLCSCPTTMKETSHVICSFNMQNMFSTNRVCWLLLVPVSTGRKQISASRLGKARYTFPPEIDTCYQQSYFLYSLSLCRCSWLAEASVFWTRSCFVCLINTMYMSHSCLLTNRACRWRNGYLDCKNILLCMPFICVTVNWYIMIEIFGFIPLDVHCCSVSYWKQK